MEKERISLEEVKERLEGTKYELIEVCPELEFYKEEDGTHVMICAECCLERLDRERRKQNMCLGKEQIVYIACPPKGDPRCYVIRDKTI